MATILTGAPALSRALTRGKVAPKASPRPAFRQVSAMGDVAADGRAVRPRRLAASMKARNFDKTGPIWFLVFRVSVSSDSALH